ncbi:MAG: hypothetical protein ABI488_04290 [Polyangiaceae bacterium]
MLTSRPWLFAVSVCVACGSSFSAADKGAPGGTSGAGEAGNVGTSGGDTTDAGDAGTGAVSTAGGAASAGAGGASAGSGGSAGGFGGSSAGAGGAHAGAGGSSAGAGGSGGGADCAKLRSDYLATLELARVCDKGSTEQCSVASSLPGSCCPVFVNAKSQYTTLAKKQQQAMTDAGCHYAVCTIACLLSTSASCAQQSMASGNTFMCTGTAVLQ